MALGNEGTRAAQGLGTLGFCVGTGLRHAFAFCSHSLKLEKRTLQIGA